MAITVAGQGTAKGRINDVTGSRRISRFQITLDSSYPTGGYAFDPKANGHQGAVASVRISPRYSSGANGTTTRRFEYDHTAKKIIGFVTSTGVEIGNAVSVASVVLDVDVLSD